MMMIYDDNDDDDWWWWWWWLVGNVQGLLCPTQLEGRRCAEWTFYSDSVLKFHQIPNYWRFSDSVFLLSKARMSQRITFGRDAMTRLRLVNLEIGIEWMSHPTLCQNSECQYFSRILERFCKEFELHNSWSVDIWGKIHFLHSILRCIADVCV